MHIIFRENMQELHFFVKLSLERIGIFPFLLIFKKIEQSHGTSILAHF